MKYPGILTCLCYDAKSDLADISEESGFERVKRMYSTNHMGLMSPELFYLVQSASTTFVLSGAMGAAIHMMRAKENYFRQNVASSFESQHLARRKLSDTMTLSAFKGGIKYAVKYGAFSSFYLLSTMTVANYNDKITVWEHIGTGALIGSIVRINYGLKGMIAAGSLGGFLGLIAGGVLVIGMRLTNSTLQDLRNWEHVIYYEDVKKRRKLPSYKD